MESLTKFGLQRVEYYEELQNKCASLINLLGYTSEEIRDSNIRLKGYADDIAAYEAALEALEQMDDTPVREDSESEEESDSDSDKPRRRERRRARTATATPIATRIAIPIATATRTTRRRRARRANWERRRR